MREFQSKVSLLLRDHKNHKRYLAFLLALSMIVSVAVPFSLIMPAVSMAVQDVQTENMGVEGEWFTGVQTTIPDGAVNLADRVTSLTYDLGDESDGKRAVAGTFNYAFSKEQAAQITLENPYAYF